MESSMTDISILREILENIDLQDPAETRFALYRLRAEAWAIMAEIDKYRLAEWEEEQGPQKALSLEDIGL
jgi:hypothetical protein